jgi:acetoin utilization protein AcuC
MKYGMVYSHDFNKFSLGPNHPFNLSRGERFYQLLERNQLLSNPDIELIRPRPAPEELLLVAHSPEYLKALKDADGGEFKLPMLNYGLGSEDCPVFPGMYQFCRLAAGASFEAGFRALSGECDFIFSPVGGFHHCKRSFAEGFCYVNDINLIARMIMLQGYKVVYIDFDAHHSNGVQDEFYRDRNFLLISFHENGKYLYPGTGFETELGEGPGRGYKVNIPMEPASDDEVFLYLYRELVPPLIDAFKPDFGIVVFGADPITADPLTHLRLTNNSLAEVALDLKKRLKRWLGLGAGGYNLEATARTWALVWSAITDQDSESDLSMLGGAFLGSTEMGVSGFRDLRSYTSGPDKANAMNEARRVARYLKHESLPLVGANS